MAKSSDKKTTIILLIILAVSVIGGGLWTYNSLRPVETTEIIPNQQSDSLAGLSIDTVYQIKEEAIANIVDFLGTKDSTDNIWKDFYTNKQFNRLNDVNLNIDISDYKNNPHPFVMPTSTQE